MPCLWCEVDAFGSFLQKECVNKSFFEISSYKSRRWNCNCAIFEFSYQTCSKMFVLFVVSVHVVFSCVYKLIAFEFQVLVFVVCSWDIFSISLESFLGNNQVVMFFYQLIKLVSDRSKPTPGWISMQMENVTQTMLLASRTEWNG